MPLCKKVINNSCTLSLLISMVLLLHACGGGGSDSPTSVQGDGETIDTDITSSSDNTTSTDTANSGLLFSMKSLNDTGFQACADVKDDNNLDCNAAADTEGDLIPFGQDGHFGLDASSATNNDSDGHAGFSFTKLGSSGEVLLQGASAWTCIKDNVTGLIWESKTTDGKLHDVKDDFSWYEPDNSINGGSEGFKDAVRGTINCEGYITGQPDTYCNTNAFVKRANAENYCGFSDWRLPTLPELTSIVDFSRNSPAAIDSTYFPNTDTSYYLTSTPLSEVIDRVWSIDFRKGTISHSAKSSQSTIRLVRSSL